MEYQASSKYIRTSTRKMRLMADAIRRFSPQEALVQLTQQPMHASKPLADVIASALAGAKQKQVQLETLKFKTIEVMGGPAMKRWRAVSKGSAHGYKKRMTHLRVVLTDEGVKE